MRFWDIVMTAATQSGGSAGPAPPTELFPDPTLADVADATNGWALGGFTATGGTGPGLTGVFMEESGTAELTGADAADFASAVVGGSTNTVAITFGVGSSGTIRVSLSGDGDIQDFVASGTVSHDLPAAATPSFNFTGNDGDPFTGTITHISVIAA